MAERPILNINRDKVTLTTDAFLGILEGLIEIGQEAGTGKIDTSVKVQILLQSLASTEELKGAIGRVYINEGHVSSDSNLAVARRMFDLFQLTSKK